ncbi:MAG: hypothetical protein LBQ66_09190, partial [Planctomycetaceae bacterium]|nr:hypothetical protein [Planctomycetaceae bacterium]
GGPGGIGLLAALLGGLLDKPPLFLKPGLGVNFRRRGLTGRPARGLGRRPGSRLSRGGGYGVGFFGCGTAPAVQDLVPEPPDIFVGGILNQKIVHKIQGPLKFPGFKIFPGHKKGIRPFLRFPVSPLESAPLGVIGLFPAKKKDPPYHKEGQKERSPGSDND